MDPRIKRLTRCEIILHDNTVIDIKQRGLEMEINPLNIHSRLINGWQIEKALTVKETAYNHLHHAFGVYKTMRQWSYFSGIGLMTLHSRYTTQKLGLEDALTKEFRGVKISQEMKNLVKSYNESKIQL